MRRRSTTGAFAALLLAGAFLAFLAGGGCGAVYEDETEPDAARESAPSIAAESGPSKLTDAADAADVSSFCTMQSDATFCADFEHVAEVAQGWSVGAIDDQGSVVLADEGAAASPLHAALATATALDAGSPDGGSQSAVLVHEIALPPGTLVLEADLRIEDLPPAGQSKMIRALGFTSASAKASAAPAAYLSFARSAKNANEIQVTFAVDKGAGPASTSTAIPKGFHDWFHVRLEIHRVTNGLVKLEIDGVEYGAFAPGTVFQTVTTLRVFAGVVATRGPSRNVVLVDNVVVRGE